MFSLLCKYKESVKIKRFSFHLWLHLIVFRIRHSIGFYFFVSPLHGLILVKHITFNSSSVCLHSYKWKGINHSMTWYLTFYDSWKIKGNQQIYTYPPAFSPASILLLVLPHYTCIYSVTTNLTSILFLVIFCSLLILLTVSSLFMYWMADIHIVIVYQKRTYGYYLLWVLTLFKNTCQLIVGLRSQLLSP